MWLLLIIKLFYLCEVESSLAEDVQDLTEIFFSNLNSDPLLSSRVFNKESEDFINEQIENYIALQKDKYRVNERKLWKRSAEYEIDYNIGESNGTYLFDGFSSFDFTIARNASDIFFIEQNNTTYLLTLQQEGVNSSLVFEELNAEKSQLIFKELIGTIDEVITYKTASDIFVIITNRRGVLICTIANNALEKMQELHLQNISDAIVWESSDDTFLAISRDSNGTSCKNSVLIYKWLGKHFDLIHNAITTYCAKSISATSVGSTQFLAVANYRNDEGQTRLHSEIFKYNLDTDGYELYQRILTNGAVDVEFISLHHNRKQETYLVVANSLKDENHFESKVTSIIYKYVDKHFIPFQSIANATDKWTAVSETSGEFLLVSQSEVQGIRAFIYDGWTFVKQNIETKNDQFASGVVYTGFQKYANNIILKISNKNVNNARIDLYKLNFLPENTFKSFRKDLLDWCERSLNEVNDFKMEELQNMEDMKSTKIAATPKEYEEKFENDDATVRKTRQFAQDYDGFPEDLDGIDLLNLKLEEQLQELVNIKADLDNYLPKSGVVQIEADIIAENAIINKEIFFESNLDVETINDIDFTTYMTDLINIHENHDFSDEEFSFENARVEDSIGLNYLNGNNIADLISCNDSIDFNDVSVEGKVILNNGIQVGGSVNGIDLDLSKIVLIEGDQDFSNQDVTFEKIRVYDATKVKRLNKLNLDDIPDESMKVIERLDNLNVKKLVIGGKLNGKDIKALNENALRTHVDLQMIENCTFETLDVENLFVTSTLSNKLPEDALLTDYDGTYDLTNRDVLFTGDISCKELHVRKRLNNLHVLENGRLNVLLRNSTQEQYVNGSKIFESLKVLNSITLRSKIDSERLKNMNPVQLIRDDEIEVKGDYTFTGDVVAERTLKVRDMKASNSERSVQDVLFKGLGLDEEDLSHHFMFKQHINVDAIHVDTINGLKTKDFLVNGNDVEQYITGNKLIKNDLHITGSTKLFNVNDIHIPTLVKDILYIDGDQEITGKHTLQEIKATSIEAANTRLGDHVWRDIVTISGNQTLYGTTVIDTSTEVVFLKANITTIEGSLSGYNLTDILSDTADNNTTELKGHKTFKELHADSITVSNGINITSVERRLKDWQNNLFVIEGDFIFPDNIWVEKLEVSGYLNDMSSEDFKRNWNDGPKTVRTFHGPYAFENVTMLENVIILSNEINGVSLTDIMENTVKTNETFRFDYVKFDRAVVARAPITLRGDLVGLDLENVVTCERQEQAVPNLIFTDDVGVFGNVEFNGLVNGYKYQHLCDFSGPNSSEFAKNLTIDGNAHFSKALAIKTINDVPIDELHENVWLSNRETELNGHIEFEIVNFEDDVSVTGLVDEVDLSWLSSNYFSKTKNQTITANLDFTDGIVFLKGVSAPEIALPGSVSGVHIDEFVKTAVLNNIEQEFYSPIYLQSSVIENLYGEYLVNDMNLPKDVMRYDAENTITGYKYIPNIITRNLLLKPNTTIQNVDLFEWMHRSSLKSGGHVSGDCLFHGNVTFVKGLGHDHCIIEKLISRLILQVETPNLLYYECRYYSKKRVVGKVNGITFNNNNILMKSEAQIISGKKTIATSFPLTFEELNLKQFLNGVNITSLIQNQAHRTEDNLIETPINFKGDLIVNNLNIEKLYNDVNVTKLIKELSEVQDLNNYYEDYAVLLNTSIRVSESLMNQGLFLDHYDIMQRLDQAFDVSYLFYQNNPCLAIVRPDKTGIDILKWNGTSEMFNIHSGTISIKIADITYLSVLNLRKKYYLYFEYRNSENTEFTGSLSLLNDSQRIIQNLITNGTKHIETLLLPDKQQECLIFSYNYEKYLNIYCDSFSKEIWFDEIHQRLDTCTNLPVSTLIIGLNVYIFIVNNELDASETMLEIWKFDINTRLFNKHQIIFHTSINSISTITYKSVQYLAVSSGHLQDAVYQGIVEIYRFDTEQFTHWQDIIVEAPIKVQFLILPSEELILYILTDNPAKPLVVYAYQGLERFQLKQEMMSLSRIWNMKAFNTNDGNSFLSTVNNEGTTLIRSYFRGYKRG